MWLLFVPLLRSILIKPQTIGEIIANYSADILFSALVIATAVFCYKETYCIFNKKQITIEKRFLVKIEDITHLADTFCLAEKRGVLCRVFAATKIAAVTPDIKSGKSVYLSAKQKKALEDKFAGGDKEEGKTFKLSFIRVFIHCFLQSDFLSGLAASLLIIKRTGAILGDEYSEYIYSRIDVSRFSFVSDIPPLLGRAAGLAFAGWLVAVFVQSLQLANFRIYSDSEKICVSSGVIQRLCFVVKKKKIYSLTVRQNIWLALFKKCAVYVDLPKNKEEKSVMLLPTENVKKAACICENIVGLDMKKAVTVKPHNALFSYVLAPFLCIIAAAAVRLFINTMTYVMISGRVFDFLFVILFLFLVLWFVFRIFAYKKAALKYCDRAAEISFYRGLSFETVLVKKRFAQCIRIRQNPVQKLNGRCSLYLYTYRGKTAKIKHIDLNKASEFAEKFCDDLD